MSYKSYDHTCNNNLVRIRNVVTTYMSTMRLLLEIVFILKAIKSMFEE